MKKKLFIKMLSELRYKYAKFYLANISKVLCLISLPFSFSLILHICLFPFSPSHLLFSSLFTSLLLYLPLSSFQFCFHFLLFSIPCLKPCLNIPSSSNYFTKKTAYYVFCKFIVKKKAVCS